jgi:hypothetical protein
MGSDMEETAVLVALTVLMEALMKEINIEARYKFILYVYKWEPEATQHQPYTKTR